MPTPTISSKEEDAIQGIYGTETVVGALQQLEQKHFRERYTQKILSNSYREILHAFVRIEDETGLEEVATQQLRAKLPDVSQIGPYLSNMVKRQVLVRVDGKRGVFRLPDRMFGLFLRMAAEKFDRRKA